MSDEEYYRRKAIEELKIQWANQRKADHVSRERRIRVVTELIIEAKLSHRFEFPGRGRCVLDGRAHFYIHSRKSRLKGSREYCQLEGFGEFLSKYANVDLSRELQMKHEVSVMRSIGVVDFGRFKGSARWEELPDEYLQWMADTLKGERRAHGILAKQILEEREAMRRVFMI